MTVRGRRIAVSEIFFSYAKTFVFFAETWNYNTNRNEHVRKFLVICAIQIAGGVLLKLLKFCKVMLNIFKISRV